MMRVDATLLKDILESVANIGYGHASIGIDQLGLKEKVPSDKLVYHITHLLKEDYLEGRITEYHGGRVIEIVRMTDKGALFVDTTENPEFLEWVKKNTGSAFGDLMKDTVKGSASIGWGLLKQWLAEQGLSFPGKP